MTKSSKKSLEKTLGCTILEKNINSISKYFDTLDAPLQANDANTYWFRGHSNISWKLCPSALRPKEATLREKALVFNSKRI